MNKILNTEYVDKMIADFPTIGAEYFGIAHNDWVVMGYQLHIQLGEVWETLGYHEREDFDLAESVGTAASLTMSIVSERMVCEGLIASTHAFLQEHPGIMVIIYGDVEFEDSEMDSTFRIVFLGDIVAADFERSDYAARCGFT
jgi:hypothetical protein